MQNYCYYTCQGRPQEFERGAQFEAVCFPSKVKRRAKKRSSCPLIVLYRHITFTPQTFCAFVYSPSPPGYAPAYSLSTCPIKVGQMFMGILHHNQTFEVIIEKSDYEITNLIVMRKAYGLSAHWAKNSILSQGPGRSLLSFHKPFFGGMRRVSSFYFSQMGFYKILKIYSHLFFYQF